MTHSPSPTALSLEEGRLVIAWSDGVRSEYRVTDLRERCPCATCNAARSQSRTVYDESAFPPGRLAIRRVTPVGNYAYKIEFNDGHDTGIYTLDTLRAW